jgi:hypothetical protein
VPTSESQPTGRQDPATSEKEPPAPSSLPGRAKQRGDAVPKARRPTTVKPEKGSKEKTDPPAAQPTPVPTPVPTVAPGQPKRDKSTKSEQGDTTADAG